MSEDNFGERVQRVADIVGGIAALSRTTRIAKRTIKNYIDGDNDPSRKKFVALADAGNVSFEWLATGKGPVSRVISTNGVPVSQFEDPLIKELRIWLRDMTADHPEWRAWFDIELQRKIPEFAEWRKKNQQSDSDEKLAAS